MINQLSAQPDKGAFSKTWSQNWHKTRTDIFFWAPKAILSSGKVRNPWTPFSLFPWQCMQITASHLVLDFLCSLSGLLLLDLDPEELDRLRLLERLFLSLSRSLSLSLLRGLSFLLFSWLLLRDLRFRWLSLSFFLKLGLRLRLLDDALCDEALSDLFRFLSLSRSLGLLLLLSFPFSGLLLLDRLRSLFRSLLRDRRLLSLLPDLDRDLFLRLFKYKQHFSS